MTEPGPSPAYRLLALVLTALFRGGLQHVAEARVEGEERLVSLVLLVNPKLRHTVDHVATSVMDALAAVDVAALWAPGRSLTLLPSPARPAALQASPSAEGLAAACQVALRARMRALDCPGADRMQLRGVSVPGGGSLYVTGGDNAINAKAAGWCARWMGRHFPEVVVIQGRHQVSGLEAEQRGSSEWERVLRLTIPVSSATRAA